MVNYGNFYPARNVLPPQQIIQVNGKTSVDTIQLAPNSSLLAMDTTAPIVWMCVSDGIGNVTSTPYDIVIHKEAPQVDIEQRLSNIELMVKKLEEKLNEESDDGKFKSKQSIADDIAV